MQASTHKHAPWRKSVLIPAWIVQLFFEFWMVVIMGLALGVVIANDTNETITNRTAVEVVAAIWMVAGLVSLILTITEIVMLARHKLKPKTFVVMNTIKSTIWFGLFVYDVVALALFVSDYRNGGRVVSGFSIIVEGLLMLSFVGPLIYGSIIYHRSRKARGTYTAVDHPYDIPIDTSYPSPYGDVGPSELSTSEMDVEAGRARRGSYSHQRDTRFQDYARERDGGEEHLENAEMGSRTQLR